jgi:hypothetical protein
MLYFFTIVRFLGFALEMSTTLCASQFRITMDTISGKYKLVCADVQGVYVTLWEDIDNPHDIVRLYKTYMSLIPRVGSFYRKPLAPTVQMPQPRFGLHAISESKIAGYLKSMFDQDGFQT